MKKLLLCSLLVLVAGCSQNGTLLSSPDAEMVTRGYDSLNRGDIASAENAFNQALRTNPGNPYALLNLGVVYERTGRINQAKSMYNKVVEMNSIDQPLTVTNPAQKSMTLSQIARANLARLE